jgi:aryl sulfotransferase
MTAYRKRMSTLLRPAEQRWLENGGGLLAEVFAGGDTQPS